MKENKGQTWIGDFMEKRIGINKQADMDRLAKIIESKGGIIFRVTRAYYPHHFYQSSGIKAPLYNLHVNLDTKEFIFNMSSNDDEYYDEALYKKAFVDFLRP